MTRASRNRRRPEQLYRREETSRGGMTLIELLIVILIILMITASSIPLMVSGVEGRKLREAGRLVNSFISSARTRAIENGRPVGVRIERFDGAPNVAMRLSLVEVPPPYAGEADSSRALIGIPNPPNPKILMLVRVGMNLDGPTRTPPTPPVDDSLATTLVRTGDLIKFNYQGRTYGILQPNSDKLGQPLSTPTPDTPWRLVPTDGDTRFPSPTPADGVPFQIFRRPQPGTGKPLQLPEGTVIDLDLSGSEHLWGMGQFTSQYATNPMILFSPGGAINVLYDQHDVTKGNEPEETHPPDAPLYLHIGRREGASDISKFGDAKNPRNLYDLNNLWVGIGYQTGLVTTSENGAKPKSELEVDWPIQNPTVQQQADIARHLRYARGIAKTAQTMGGR